MEETMRVLTIEELMRLTRIELTRLLVRNKGVLPDYPEGSVEPENALTSLRNIRCVVEAGLLTVREDEVQSVIA
jgi:hypothetical protein